MTDNENLLAYAKEHSATKCPCICHGFGIMGDMPHHKDCAGGACTGTVPGPTASLYEALTVECYPSLTEDWGIPEFCHVSCAHWDDAERGYCVGGYRRAKPDDSFHVALENWEGIWAISIYKKTGSGHREVGVTLTADYGGATKLGPTLAAAVHAALEATP
jgi:hypothetical protein